MADRAEFVKPEKMKVDEALRFFVLLANADVEKLCDPNRNPGDFASLIYVLKRYLFVTPREKKLAKQIKQAERDPRLFKPVIKAARTLLDAIIAVSEDGNPAHLVGIAFPIQKQTIGLTIEEDDKIASVRDYDDLFSAVLDTAVEDFDDTKWKLLRIGRCQECLHDPSRYFYKLKLNQGYCSHDCANKAAAARRTVRIKGGAKKNPEI